MTIPVKTLHEAETLEERLQVAKWTLIIPRPFRRRRLTNGSRIVSRTAGLLGKRIPSGVIYEQRLRKTWASRLRRLGR